MPYIDVIVLCVCAITFYRAGQLERSWGLLWAALSIAGSILSLLVLKWDLFGVLLAQVVVFLGITAYRMWRHE